MHWNSLGGETYALGSIDLLIDKQELIRNKVLKANGLCGSDTMDVSLRRQFESKIFGFRKISEPLGFMTVTSVNRPVRCLLRQTIASPLQNVVTSYSSRRFELKWKDSAGLEEWDDRTEYKGIYGGRIWSYTFLNGKLINWTDIYFD